MIVFEKSAQAQRSREGHPVDLAVVHYTRSMARDLSGWIVNSGVSYHALFHRNGRVTQLVPWDRAAQHAGGGEVVLGGEAVRHINSRSIGLALSNCGPLEADEEGFFYMLGDKRIDYSGPDPIWGELAYDNGDRVQSWWEPYTAAQIQSLKRYLKELAFDGYELAAQSLVGHEEINMPFGVDTKTGKFKADPGPLFPWDYFPHIEAKRTSRTFSVEALPDEK